MGMLVEGRWIVDDRAFKQSADGRFKRAEAPWRNWVTADGCPGPSGKGGFKAEAGRYHLYVSHACPWAHRTMVLRALKGLEDTISVSVTHWLMLEDGWSFEDGPGVVPDPLHGAGYMRDVYLAADPAFTGRCSVPVLWDRETGTIVSNESSEIIRMFDGAFDAVARHPERHYTVPELLDAIDRVNARVFSAVNNGVYRTGFARTQEAYEEAVTDLFTTLDWLEGHLSARRWLVGDRITEADWRLFTTLLRFDPVYHGHFKCNIRKLIDYPALSAYLRDLYQTPGIAATVRMDHIKGHYYGSHRAINPLGIVPKGPALDLESPHRREGLN